MSYVKLQNVLTGRNQGLNRLVYGAGINGENVDVGEKQKPNDVVQSNHVYKIDTKPDPDTFDGYITNPDNILVLDYFYKTGPNFYKLMPAEDKELLLNILKKLSELEPHLSPASLQKLHKLLSYVSDELNVFAQERSIKDS